MGASKMPTKLSLPQTRQIVSFFYTLSHAEVKTFFAQKKTA
jgi:hypothetical protein